MAKRNSTLTLKKPAQKPLGVRDGIDLDAWFEEFMKPLRAHMKAKEARQPATRGHCND